MLALADTKTLTVRSLTVEEVPLACAIGQEFQGVSGMAGTFQPARYLASWRAAYTGGRGVIIGLWREDTLCGVLGALLGEDMETGVRRVNESFWYVLPDARQWTAVKMLAAMEQWGRAGGATHARAGYLAYEGMPVLHRLYVRLRYRLIRYTYEKEL